MRRRLDPSGRADDPAHPVLVQRSGSEWLRGKRIRHHVQMLPNGTTPNPYFGEWHIASSYGDGMFHTVRMPYILPLQSNATETNIAKVWQQNAARLSKHHIDQETLSFYQVPSTNESYVGFCVGRTHWVV